MGRLILTGVQLVDGDHPPVAGATVVVDGRHLGPVGPAPVAAAPDDVVLSLPGHTVLPGLITCHFHATYHDLGSVRAPFGLEEPPALQAVRAARHLELALQCGFTGAVSAGAPFAIDASMQRAIAEGLINGPRLVAGSRDVSTTGHAGDKSFPWYWDVGAQGAVRRCNGAEEFRRGVREEIAEGAQIIKMFVTGGHGTVAPREQIEMTREELSAGIEAAHLRGAKVRGHIANREAIHLALDCGIDVIDHADGMDEECIERIVDAGTFVVPSQYFPYRFAESMGPGGLGFTESLRADLEESLAILPKANEAGVKLVVGDDYGALGFPHGHYAEELAFYVEHAGIDPLDVVRWATKHGAELMGRGHELGTLTEGKLADLVVVDGDPLADLGLLADRSRLTVLKGGRVVAGELPGLAA
ncbi:MAG TPA: amidohydrolase family protein [Acidimicrobiales bacterium]|nr:amidohydrolase family protein [Acidimicrobiales bacterium]